MIPTLIIHGGTGAKNPEALAKMRVSLQAIVEQAYKVLEKEGAMAACVEAVRLMEDDSLFNAGTGSRIQKDGVARLSASVMDGSTQTFAGVINLEGIRNPVRVAQALLKEKNRVLAGPGAHTFALERGFETMPPAAKDSANGWQPKCDTVGACALDAQGRLASATSTGGIGGETPGRVSDSATPAGNFCNANFAISATGIGEQILDEALAATIAAYAETEGTEKAFQKVFDGVRARKRAMGAIGLDRAGKVAWDTTSPELVWGWKREATSQFFQSSLR